MIPAPELVEQALGQSRVDGCVVLVTDASEASLRWANSTMTTNGVSTSRTWAVISVVGTSVGVVSSTSVAPADISAVVRASEEAARAAGPARDAAPLVTGHAAEPTWDKPAAQTDITVFDRLTGALAEGFLGSDVLYGFASHQLHTTWLASSTGLRRRFVQPTGSVEVNAKRDGSSAWGGVGTRDFTDVDIPAILDDLSTRLGWGQRQVELPAGRYETILPPSAAADLMIYLAWTMEGRGRRKAIPPCPGPAAPGSASGSPSCRSPWRSIHTPQGWSTRRSWPPRNPVTMSRSSTTAWTPDGWSWCATGW